MGEVGASVVQALAVGLACAAYGLAAKDAARRDPDSDGEPIGGVVGGGGGVRGRGDGSKGRDDV